MKYVTGLLLILLLHGCALPLDYYRFQVTTFPFPRKSTASITPDSTLVLKALTRADTSDLLKQDWDQLKSYAKDHQLVLKTEKRKILVEKYEKKTQGEAGEVTAETKENARELKDMKLIGSNPGRQFVRLFLLMLLGVALLGLVLYLLMVAAVDEVAESFSCYIATVCYGDGNASQVVILRRFRDQVLRKYFIGRVFVGTYYMFSPPIARFLKGKDRINYCIRGLLLDPIVFVVRKCITASPADTNTVLNPASYDRIPSKYAGSS